MGLLKQAKIFIPIVFDIAENFGFAERQSDYYYKQYILNTTASGGMNILMQMENRYPVHEHISALYVFYSANESFPLCTVTPVAL